LMQQDDHGQIAFDIQRLVRIAAARIYGGTPVIRMGTCSSLLHSTSIGDNIQEVENEAGEVTGNPAEWARERLFQQWYRWYDPAFLFFSRPPVLSGFVDTPLDWYAQTNAFYDTFRGVVVISPGLLHLPFYGSGLDPIPSFARLGYVVGHEVGHAVASANPELPHCLSSAFDIVTESVQQELYADVVGVRLALQGLVMATGNETLPCDYFLSYAQMYCAADSKRVDGIHPPPKFRVNFPILYGTKDVVKTFNECFGCSLRPQCV